MLSEETISRLALLAAAAGAIMLFALNAAIDAKEIKISEINESRVGELVIVHGKIDNAHQAGGNIIFTLNDGAKIKAVAFSPGEEEIRLLRKNSFVEVEGKIQLYREELEIVANTVREWK